MEVRHALCAITNAFVLVMLTALLTSYFIGTALR
jgi:hypothetical protein